MQWSTYSNGYPCGHTEKPNLHGVGDSAERSVQKQANEEETIAAPRCHVCHGGRTCCQFRRLRCPRSVHVGAMSGVLSGDLSWGKTRTNSAHHAPRAWEGHPHAGSGMHTEGEGAARLVQPPSFPFGAAACAAVAFDENVVCAGRLEGGAQPHTAFGSPLFPCTASAPRSGPSSRLTRWAGGRCPIVSKKADESAYEEDNQRTLPEGEPTESWPSLPIGRSRVAAISKWCQASVPPK